MADVDESFRRSSDMISCEPPPPFFISSPGNATLLEQGAEEGCVAGARQFLWPTGEVRGPGLHGGPPVPPPLHQPLARSSFNTPALPIWPERGKEKGGA